LRGVNSLGRVAQVIAGLLPLWKGGLGGFKKRFEYSHAPKSPLMRPSHDWQNEFLNRNFAMINHVSQRDRFSWLIYESRFFAAFWLS
jgi:hypothetical protein